MRWTNPHPMNITVNGEPVYIDPDTILEFIPIIFPVIFFLIFFGIIASVIRSVGKSVKTIKNQFPKGTLKELNNIRRQLPKGMNWQQLMDQWDIKIDKESGKIKIKKKSQSGESTIGPTEMKVTHMAQLPAAMRKALNILDQNTSQSISQASAPKPPKMEQSANPFLNEGAGTILKIALGIVVVIALYVIGFFLAG